jgi:hypothetical protein
MIHRARFLRARSAAAHRSVFASVFATAFAIAPSMASADNSKAQCIEANTKSQDLRREGKLAEAREQLKRCGDPACPRIVRDDCAQRLDDLDKAQPSLIFDVKDARGGDIIDVRVSVDGRPLVDRLDGTPLKIDPGAHTLTFDVAGQPPVSAKVLIREGEAGRHERVVFDGVNAAAPAPSTASEAATSPASGPVAPSSGGSAQRTLGLVVGGVGVAGLAAGVIFWQLGGSAWDSAKQACGGNAGACTNIGSAASYHDTASTDATVATAAFIAGAALLAAGGVLFLTGPREKRATARIEVAPSVGPRSAGLSVAGGF